MPRAILPAQDRFSALDRVFARFLTDQSGGVDPLLALCAALTSRAVGEGDSCLPLAPLAGKPWPPDEAPGRGFFFPELPEIVRRLSATGQVGAPGDFRPLILTSSGRLYLHRFFEYESAVARALLSRCRKPPGYAAENMQQYLAELFPPGDPRTSVQQREAATAAAASLFSVVTGGPGTGKTHTAARIIALLLLADPGRRILLSAPTGKAAARLSESLGRAACSLALPAPVAERFPLEAATIHRLLGAKGRGSGFAHDSQNPLAADTVLVDEASMVDLPLMFSLVSALPPDCRLILLGDRDQLSSVEPGSVFSDICGGTAAAGRGLAGAITVLTENFRFPEDSGIHRLARLVLEGRDREALDLLREDRRADLAWVDASDPEALSRKLGEEALSGYARHLAAASPGEMLAAREDFVVLAAVRRGPLGLLRANEFLTALFARNNLLRPGVGAFFHARPLLVTVNDYAAGLLNGDMGCVFGNAAYFPSREEEPRRFAAALLPSHETAWAITVHKAQGSEFDTVFVLLPENPSPVATRELLYTAVTRARRRVVVAASPASFSAAVTNRARRSSGLGEALWAGPAPESANEESQLP
ncbi:MAG: exodeoxyribonuclease V subunit alpha [Thermodesulfobacteriota bacterium]